MTLGTLTQLVILVTLTLSRLVHTLTESMTLGTITLLVAMLVVGLALLSR
ncbi:hypothetical protein IQ273_28050 [Nodosilinea sp. LEGE 07298]|nr:hypothetical protein [Nodosilinea sp. LEGE 07298]